EPQEMVLLKDVEEFRLRFYQRDKSPNWLDSWPEQVAQNNQAKQDKLPAGIEMQLKLKNQETITRLFHVGT
ncbi:MAG: type II secretion system protein GspJ, partial [Gammaproteobacteria bacterium]|nr:type II secretion system protein GspJ [Gammaproteobacteria bacterium]